MSDIYSKLLAAQAQSSPPFQAEFWPEGSLSSVITENAVETLGIHDEDLQGFILQDAIKLFAICLSIRIQMPQLATTMIIFRREGLDDACLPVCEQVMNQRLTDLPWYESSEKMDFLRNQWKFIAPSLLSRRGRSSIPRLGEDEVLPFTSVEGLPQSEQGTYATVYKVQLHPSYCEPIPYSTQPENHYFAVKCVNFGYFKRSEATVKDFGEEWETLNSLRRRGAMKHLVEIKAIFDLHCNRYFMIPWASGGSLRQLLTNERRIHDQRPGELIKHTAAQLLGMAEALARLHCCNCRHGYLVPENILIFRDDSQARLGTWKIADLGLAKFHFDPTARRGAVSTMYGTISYEAPEFLDTIRDHGGLSQLFDVWSMGCIILQLITWLLYDSQGVENLADRTWNRQREASTLWAEEHLATGTLSRQIIHNVVQTHMAKILVDPIGSKAIKDLITVVQDKLFIK